MAALKQRNKQSIWQYIAYSIMIQNTFQWKVRKLLMKIGLCEKWWSQEVFPAVRQPVRLRQTAGGWDGVTHWVLLEVSKSQCVIDLSICKVSVIQHLIYSFLLLLLSVFLPLPPVVGVTRDPLGSALLCHLLTSSVNTLKSCLPFRVLLYERCSRV